MRVGRHLSGGHCLRRTVLGKLLGQMRGVGHQHFGNAWNLRSRRSRASTLKPGNQHMDLGGAGERARDRVVGRSTQARVVMFGNHKSSHKKSFLADDLGFVAQFVDQRIDVWNLDTRRSRLGLDHFQRLEPRRRVDP